MRKLSFSMATCEAMAEEMALDDKIFVMGEDLARQGGIFGQFKGLPEKFPGRVIDTPISETFIIGGGVGAALAGAARSLICTLPTSSASAWMRFSTRWPRSAICSAGRQRCRWFCALPMG